MKQHIWNFILKVEFVLNMNTSWPWFALTPKVVIREATWSRDSSWKYPSWPPLPSDFSSWLSPTDLIFTHCNPQTLCFELEKDVYKPKIFTTLFYVDICKKRLAFLILPIWLINNISQIQYIYYRILIDLNLYDNFFSYDYTK